MNSQRWREITSSFPCPDARTDTRRANNSTAISSLQIQVHDKEGPSSDPQPRRSEDKGLPIPTSRGHNLDAKVAALQSLLHEKAKLIEEQGKLIAELEKRLARPQESSYCVRSDGLPSKWRNKDTQKILESVEGLESKMSKLVTSLPRRISQLCDEYMKEFYKEELDDASLPHLKAFWSKTPNIKPRSNLSSNLRELQVKMAQNQVRSTEEEDVQAKLAKLEHLVSDLKASFLQLLVDKLASARRRRRHSCSCKCEAEKG